MRRSVAVLLLLSLYPVSPAISGLALSTRAQDQQTPPKPPPPPPENPPTGPPAGEPTASAGESAATAEESTTTHHKVRHKKMGSVKDTDVRVVQMTKRYKLTDDQQSQIRALLEDEQEEMQSVRSDTSASREDQRAKMKSLGLTINRKIEAVLTDEQKEKYEADLRRKDERRADDLKGPDTDLPAKNADKSPAQPQ